MGKHYDGPKAVMPAWTGIAEVLHLVQDDNQGLRMLLHRHRRAVHDFLNDLLRLFRFFQG